MISGITMPSPLSSLHHRLNPHIYLKRKGSYKYREQWRLDNLLLKKAVHIVFLFLPILCTVCGHLSVERRCPGVYHNFQGD